MARARAMMVAIALLVMTARASAGPSCEDRDAAECMVDDEASLLALRRGHQDGSAGHAKLAPAGGKFCCWQQKYDLSKNSCEDCMSPQYGDYQGCYMPNGLECGAEELLEVERRESFCCWQQKYDLSKNSCEDCLSPQYGNYQGCDMPNGLECEGPAPTPAPAPAPSGTFCCWQQKHDKSKNSCQDCLSPQFGDYQGCNVHAERLGVRCCGAS